MSNKRAIKIQNFTVVLDWDETEQEINMVAFPQFGAYFGFMEFPKGTGETGEMSYYAVCTPMLENGTPDFSQDPIAGEVEDWYGNGEADMCGTVEKHFGVRFANHLDFASVKEANEKFKSEHGFYPWEEKFNFGK